MYDGRGGVIDHAGNVARAQAIREEQRRLADEATYRADVERRAEEDAIRSENRPGRCRLGRPMIAFFERWLRLLCQRGHRNKALRFVGLASTALPIPPSLMPSLRRKS